VVDLGDADRDRILKNFREAQGAVTHTLGLKFAFVDGLPFKACALAHHNEEVAREQGQICLELARQAGIEQHEDPAAPRPHRLTLSFFQPGSEVLQQVLQFIDGVPQRDLPLLRQRVAPLKFVMLIERSAEKNHAIAKHNTALAPKHREAYFSLALRGHLITKKIEEDPSNFELLGECCSEVRSLGKMVRRLNLLGCDALN